MPSLNYQPVASSSFASKRRLESSGENEIQSSAIGDAVMDALSNLDKVAFVRFASVYRNFREAKDFEAFVDKLGDNE